MAGVYVAGSAALRMYRAATSNPLEHDAISTVLREQRSRVAPRDELRRGGRSFVGLGEPRAERCDVLFFFEVLLVELGVVAGGAIAVRVAQAVEGGAEDAVSPATLFGLEPSVRTERAIERQLDPTGMDERAGRATHAAKSRLREGHVAAAAVQVHDLALDQTQRFERSEHSTDGGRGHAEHPPQVALEHGLAGLLDDVEQVEPSSRQPQALEQTARESQRAVIGALEIEK